MPTVTRTRPRARIRARALPHAKASVLRLPPGRRQALFTDPALGGPGEEIPYDFLAANRRALLRLVEPGELPDLLGCG